MHPRQSGPTPSWRDDPLYLEARDLALDLLPRAEAWRAAGGAALADATVTATCVVLTAVTEALTFPPGRTAALVRAERAAVDVQAWIATAAQFGGLTEQDAATLTERARGVRRQIIGSRLAS
jgi:hypothetical protein